MQFQFKKKSRRYVKNILQETSKQESNGWDCQWFARDERNIVQLQNANLLQWRQSRVAHVSDYGFCQKHNGEAGSQIHTASQSYELRACNVFQCFFSAAFFFSQNVTKKKTTQ